uniref:Dynein light chain n=1 Tax=Sarcophilus harrisii TaxID=9305 RepID=A0A7N4NMH6_SARHA
LLQHIHMKSVKIDEVLCLMCDVAAKISAHNTMPRGVIFLVEFLRGNKSSDVLLYVVLLHSLRCTVDRVLLHVLRHVCVLDYCLPVRHGGTIAKTHVAVSLAPYSTALRSEGLTGCRTSF